MKRVAFLLLAPLALFAATIGQQPAYRGAAAIQGTPVSGGGGAPDTNYTTGVNLTAGLATFKAAVANSTTGRVHIVCIGDSITEGTDTTPATGNGHITNSWSGRIRTQLQAQYGGSGVGFLGLQRVGSFYAPYNFIVSASWSLGGVGNYTGGPFNQGVWHFNNADTVKFTNVTCTEFEIYYTDCQFSGGSFVVDIGTTHIRTNAMSAQTPAIPRKLVITTNLVGQDITIHAQLVDGTADFFLNGVAFYSSTNGVYVDNVGYGGSKAGDYSTGRDWVAAMQPALTILMMDSNDYAGQTSINSYGTSITNIINTGKLYGSVMVMNGPYRDPPNLTVSQTNYYAINRTASSNLCAVLSINDRWGGLNLNYTGDSIHPNADGHTNIAAYVYGVLVP